MRTVVAHYRGARDLAPPGQRRRERRLRARAGGVRRGPGAGISRGTGGRPRPGDHDRRGARSGPAARGNAGAARPRCVTCSTAPRVNRPNRRNRRSRRPSGSSTAALSADRDGRRRGAQPGDQDCGSCTCSTCWKPSRRRSTTRARQDCSGRAVASRSGARRESAECQRTVVPIDVDESPISPPPEPGEGGRKRGFALPSAYTILFILILLTAAATWIVPAGTYEYNADGEPVPGTYHADRARPTEDPARFDQGADQRLVRDRGRDREHQLLELRRAVRRHRRRPVHHHHRRLPRRDDEDRRHQRRHRPRGQPAWPAGKS